MTGHRPGQKKSHDTGQGRTEPDSTGQDKTRQDRTMDMTVDRTGFRTEHRTEDWRRLIRRLSMLYTMGHYTLSWGKNFTDLATSREAAILICMEPLRLLSSTDGN